MEPRMSSVAQADFDRIATFVAVADELSMEPFVSDDNHEKACPAQANRWFSRRCRVFLPSSIFEIGDFAIPKIVAVV